jgi:HK97 family phage major capsid protein/HK97 family phage prohead protease
MPELGLTWSVKRVDDASRTIVGMATVPTVDRAKELVDPAGATFTLPMPFIWQHDKSTPIGEVTEARVIPGQGIEITAKVAKLDAPGPFTDRVEYAWQAITSGLVKGLSIGFIARKAVREGDHVRLTAWDWLETSVVTVPANPDTLITSVKAAALDCTIDPPQRTTTMPPTIAERIASFEEQRTNKLAQLDAIQTKASEANRTKSAEERKSFDALKTDIEAIDAELADLKTLEAAQAKSATPVVGTTTTKAAESRGGVVTVKDALDPGIEFTRYAICIAGAKGNLLQAEKIAQDRYRDNPRLQTVLKAAVDAGTTTDATWAGNLVDYRNFAGDFIEFLRPQTIIGRFGANGIPSLRRIPFKVKILSQTVAGDGYWVGEGKPKPLTKSGFAPVYLDFAKVATIAVLTDELVRFSNPSAERLVRDEIARALVARMDTDFIDPTKAAVSNVSPASITHGLTPIVSSGTDAAAIRRDVQALLAPFLAANISPSTGVFIMSETTALALSLMTNAFGQAEFPGLTLRGGTFCGYPVITSQYAAMGSPLAHMVIFANASDIYLADDGGVTIDSSREASLEMSDAPTQDATAGTGASLVSLWQNNLLGLRAERTVNWKLRRAESVAYIDDVEWGLDGSPS